MGYQQVSPRDCLGCGVLIVGRGGKAIRCVECAKRHHNARKRPRKRRNRKPLTEQQRLAKRARDRGRVRSAQSTEAQRRASREWKRKRRPAKPIRCSKAVYRQHLRAGYRLRAAVSARLIARRLTRCAWCGSSFRSDGRRRVYCSPHCGRRADKSVYGRARRAKTRAVVNPLRVFERCNWCCQACGCESPLSLRGTTHQDAPELDHRVPLSRGGEHTEANCQLLCRTCNGLKGSKTDEEFAAWRVGAA